MTAVGLFLGPDSTAQPRLEMKGGERYNFGGMLQEKIKPTMMNGAQNSLSFCKRQEYKVGRNV